MSNPSDPLNTKVDVPNPERKTPVDLGDLSNFAAEIGSSLADRSASDLRDRHTASTENDSMVDRATKGVLHAATHLDDSPQSPNRGMNNKPADLVAQVWHDPSGQSCLPLLEWLDERIKNKNAGELWGLRTLVMRHRDLASALYFAPDEAKRHTQSYEGLPTDIPKEHTQAVYAVFSLLSDMVLGAREALTVGQGVTWEDSLDKQDVAGAPGHTLKPLDGGSVGGIQGYRRSPPKKGGVI